MASPRQQRRHHHHGAQFRRMPSRSSSPGNMVAPKPRHSAIHQRHCQIDGGYQAQQPSTVHCQPTMPSDCIFHIGTASTIKLINKMAQM
jgi:hypothetical protein